MNPAPLLAASILPLLLVACGAPPAQDSAPAAPAAPAASASSIPMAQTFYDLSAPLLGGKASELSSHRGQVALVVNVASECGLTPQYAGLQALHGELAPRGFTVLGFPSNDFGGQEPGTPEQIRAFCDARFGVTFPLYAKVQTKAGPGQSPIYAHLSDATGELPSWNFGKYLVARDGRVLAYFDPRTAPDDPKLRASIEAALAEPG